MSSFPGSFRLLKGAIIRRDRVNTLARVIVFQYNSDPMTRRVKARSSGRGEGGDRSEAFRLNGPPKETITLNVELDAADQLEQDTPLATTMGTCPKRPTPFSKGWPLLFKSGQTTKTTSNR